MERSKVLLIIMDGWGLSPITEGNATYLAKTPILDYIYKNFPSATLAASGLEVGLSSGEMGNSEVGHLNIGTGRVIWESLPRIDNAIAEGSLEKNQSLLDFWSKLHNGRLHLVGLVSNGGVHSHMRHLVAMLKMAKERDIKQVYIHFISDGRDTSPKMASMFAEELKGEIKKIGLGKIATLVGRYYAMDRDERWDRTEKAYRLFTRGEGKKFDSIDVAIQSNYENGKDDEFIDPCILDEDGTIRPGDGILFFNFRADRMRQIVRAFTQYEFKGFPRNKIDPLYTASMTEYDSRFKVPVLFPPIDLMNTLADVIEGAGLDQCHIAETEKYPHVTYFFNGGVEPPHNRESQTVVPSPKVATYDLRPEMSSRDVTQKTLEAMDRGCDFIVVNYANGDMVGHTGDLNAAIKACEAVDQGVEKLLTEANSAGYKTLITADHGNCEIMINPATGEPHKEHTTNPVPLIYLDFLKTSFSPEDGKYISRQDFIEYSSTSPCGVISDIAPTVLSLLGADIPKQMSEIDLTKLI